MKVRKAVMDDFKSIVTLFRSAIQKMDANGIPQWDEIYPDEVILREDIEKNQLYTVTEDGNLVSVFVLNREYDEGYEDGNWKYPEESCQVVHRLCVNPINQNKKIGRNTMLLIEGLLREQGIESIRLDAFSKNPFALKMYEHLGFAKVGETQFRKGQFYLLEKKIS